jgi:histidinol phosphatase-like enzyme|tara:strand:- start:973 stop:1269 length:297 start_codon:yes stop_codon:yes gene_type:complete
MRVIFVDIDETICETPDNPRVYEEAKPIQENIDKINELYNEGNKIVYWTARGSRSGIDWYDLTKSQLIKWGAKHHELKCDKPYYDLFVEDKSIFIENL